MPIEYAHALETSLVGVTDEKEASNRIDALVATLEKSGKLKALPAVLREFERIQLRKNSQKPTLTIPDSKNTDAAHAELASHLDIVAGDMHTVVDENLVGGWRYVNHDTLIDASYKTALLELYRRVTTV